MLINITAFGNVWTHGIRKFWKNFKKEKFLLKKKEY